MKKQKNTTTLSTCIITPTTTASGTTFRYLHGGRAECDHITKFVLYICCSGCCCCCYRTQMYCKNLIAVRGTSLRAYAMSICMAYAFVCCRILWHLIFGQQWRCARYLAICRAVAQHVFFILCLIFVAFTVFFLLQLFNKPRCFFVAATSLVSHSTYFVVISMPGCVSDTQSGSCGAVSVNAHTHSQTRLCKFTRTHTYTCMHSPGGTQPVIG